MLLQLAFVAQLTGRLAFFASSLGHETRMLYRLSYNAPLTLSFALLSAVVLLAHQLLPGNLIGTWFSANQAGGGIVAYFKLVTYVLGHADWNHLFNNASLILVLGPMLEEKYGALPLATMMAITAVVSAAVSLWVFDTGLVGASGIAFMFIVLSSFTHTKAGTIPLTAVLVIILYLAKEIVAGLSSDNVSQFAHIMGGGFGALFGLLKRKH